MQHWEVNSMSSEFGKLLRISIFGQSHGAAVGVVMDGLPAGERIDLQEVEAFLQRRSPGKTDLTSARSESDLPEILSGLVDQTTCGAPLCAVFPIKMSSLRIMSNFAAFHDLLMRIIPLFYVITI